MEEITEPDGSVSKCRCHLIKLISLSHATNARHDLQLDNDLGREYSLMLRVSNSLIATCSPYRMRTLFSNRFVTQLRLANLDVLHPLLNNSFTKTVVKQRLPRGKTILHACVTSGQLDSLRFLTENHFLWSGLRGAKDDDGNTMLHIVVANMQHEIVQYLISENKVKCLSKNKIGKSELDLGGDNNEMKLVCYQISCRGRVRAYNTFVDEINVLAAYQWWGGSVHTALGVKECTDSKNSKPQKGTGKAKNKKKDSKSDSDDSDSSSSSDDRHKTRRDLGMTNRSVSRSFGRVPVQRNTSEGLTRQKSLSRSVYSKPKAQFGDQFVSLDGTMFYENGSKVNVVQSRGASPNYVRADTGSASLKDRTMPVTPKTTLMNYFKGIDEDGEIYKRVRSRKKLKYRKVKGKVLDEWLIFLFILGCLVTSLTVHKFGYMMLWGLCLWKWFALVMEGLGKRQDFGSYNLDCCFVAYWIQESIVHKYILFSLSGKPVMGLFVTSKGE
ncbi:hypothetical protein SASPL_157289 [Salvia splendens]|uniref:Uncharacterized protein n=1 Tax=Salvia splendens TaxID=180675 RepID=A0A8X8YUF9_SALSN|nr:hypothetical protein SASPL_157289 [Salvia splendens]